MSEKAKTLSRAEALLKRAQVLEELAAVYAAIAGEGDPPQSGLPPAVKTEEEEDEFKLALTRLPFGDAIVRVLAAAKEPQSPSEIWHALERAGRESISENPTQSVSWALRKLLTKNSDVFHVRFGRWHLRSKYKTTREKQKLEQMLRKNLGTGGRSVEAHRARTKEGMQAWRERGGKPGPKVKMTNEVIAQAMAMYEQGLKTSEIAEKLGVAKSSLYGHKVNKRKYNKTGTTEPESDGTNLRLVASNE